MEHMNVEHIKVQYFGWKSSLWLKAFPGERLRRELSATVIAVVGGDSAATTGS